jgi:RimJ/RimL family protein N-acetyltransferase
MSEDKPETIQLQDGTAVTIRPIRSDDAPRLQALMERLSPESVYYRFLAPRKALTDQQAHDLANVDYQGRMALVATVDQGEEEIIGVARYAQTTPDEPDLAEAAVVVEDRFQGQGLGTLLLKRLAAHAQAQGIRAFWATIHPTNDRIRRFIQRSGLPSKSRFESGLWEIRVELETED